MAQYVLGERAAEAVRQLMAGDSSVGRVKATVPTPVDPVEFPAPWYIEYSASEDDGNGSWVIWLPAESFKSEKSAYETAFTTMRNGMTACTSRPSGWYRVSRNLSSGGVMYLTIDTSSGSSTPTMAIEDDVSRTVMIPLAYLERDNTSGEVKTKQYQVGVMTYGGGGGGSVTPDDKSIDQLSTGEIEFKNFTTQAAEAETIAELLTTSYSSATDRNAVERNADTEGAETLGYREYGQFITGDDTNVVFTAVNGSVQIDVYYS